MIKTEVKANPLIKPVRPKGAGEKKASVKFSLFKSNVLTKSNIILTILSFLLGRSFPDIGMSTFGFPLFAVASVMGVNKASTAAALLAGLLTIGAGNSVYATVASIVLFSLLHLIFKKNMKKSMPLVAALVSLCVFIPEMVAVIMGGALLYDILNAFLSSFIAFTLAFVYSKGILVFTGQAGRKTLSGEEVVSSAILTALAIAGFSGMTILGIAIRDVMCIFLILLFGQRFGASAGTAVGTVTGIIVGMNSEYAPFIISIYAFCGLLSGVLGKLGRLGAGLGFIMGNAILTLYFNGSTIVLVSIKEILTAAILFLIIPKVLQNKVLMLYDAGVGGEQLTSSGQKIRELTVDRLNRFSATFKELSKTLMEISHAKVTPDKHDLSIFMERITDRVCRDCSLNAYCWDKSFYSTYQALFKIIETLDKKGSFTKKDIPEYFLDKCERVEELTYQLNFIYELYKVEMMWKGKMSESKKLVSRQLEGLSGVIDGLAQEIDSDVEFMGDMENMIKAELKKEGITPIEVTAYKNNLSKLEVDIRHKGCKGMLACKTVIDKVVNRISGEKMFRDDSTCGKSGKSCLLRYIQKDKYSVNTGVAVLPKSGSTVCGDCHTFIETEYGKYVAAISDGMGTGEQAATLSRAAVSLAEQFMEAGFDKDTTVQMINSIIFLKSSEDKFTTLDLTVTDLHSGKVEFVKIGAPPTFMKSREGVDIIKSVTLPAGVFGDLDLEYQEKVLESGEFVIMVSDGVLDAFGENGPEKHQSLRDLIATVQSLNAQQVADMILNEAYKRYNENPQDDMTVLVAKLWKRN
ncbi:MAG: stage II sporulation protein E [Eubacteriales bacterium]|nr:stage II sporulation protein E [Eubacteriales bacterium]